jgi:hypothetical protein
MFRIGSFASGGGTPLCWWFEPEPGEEAAQLRELGFHLGLHFERMVGDPL